MLARTTALTVRLITAIARMNSVNSVPPHTTSMMNRLSLETLLTSAIATGSHSAKAAAPAAIVTIRFSSDEKKPRADQT